MENIWGPQRKTGNMEEESLREENRKAHEEDERFRMTAVKAAGQVRQRMRCATGESDEVIRRKFMLPERYILTLMTVETLGQERMLLDLMAGGRLGADLVLCGRRSFYADMLLRTARDYEGENETYIEASVENSSSILYDKEIRNKPRTRRTKRNV